MSGVALGASLALAAFATISTATALISRLAWALAWRRFDSGPPGDRAARFLLLRTVPTAAGLGAALLVVAPAFVVFEPAQTDERVTLSLAALALAGAVLLSIGAVRTWSELVRTRRLVRTWLSGASTLVHGASRVPVFQVRSAMPVVLLAGWFRPKVLVSVRVLDRCGGLEFDAIVGHEAAHHRAGDNMKRILLAACTDLFSWTRWSRHLEERWFDASEDAADDGAVAAGSDPTELAAALLKVARLATGVDRSLATSAICRGEHVARRVRRLLDQTGLDARSMGRPRRSIPAAALAAAAGLLLGTSVALPYAHWLIEVAVAALP